MPDPQPAEDDAGPPPDARRAARPIQPTGAIQLQLLEAAGRVIGEHGYAGCTITRVTTRTRIAHGAFYLHFASQRELFDAILPTLGARMLAAIGRAIRGAHDPIDLERRGFETTFAYLARHPYMQRVQSEAALFAPEAYRCHMDRVTQGYVRSLRRSRAAGHLDQPDDELETIATMLIGARNHLLTRLATRAGGVAALPAGIVDTYLKVVARGVYRGRPA